MNPPNYTIAQVCFTVSAVLLLCRTAWWIAFEQSPDVNRITRGVIAFLLFGLIGALWVVSVTWVSGLRHLPKSQETSVELPVSRPFVTGVRYGKRESDNRDGLFVVNEHETVGYDISVSDVPIGESSTLHFWNPSLPRLSKSEGESLFEASIERGSNSRLMGSGLRSEMVEKNVESLPITVSYKDNENRRYITHCEIKRVFWGSGLQVNFKAQELSSDTAGASKGFSSLAENDPQILIEYHWRDSGDYGSTDKLGMPVVLRNAGNDTAVNVQVEEMVVGNWRATFPLVPHIVGDGSVAVLASVEYDSMQIETVVNHLISLLRPATNAGMKESRI
jgi:hypothetical protein